uniref:Uncharacterized protein n=1 Tax=Sphaeramia orbicularis TaxID=375764 RepID=A0A672YUE0_9TELE
MQLFRTNQLCLLFIILMLLKTGMDAGVLYLCCRKLYTNFLSMSNLSIFLADVIMLFSMAVVLSLKAEYSHFSLCFILAFFSATYAALPLPTMCLLLLDYCLEDTCSGKQSALGKCLRNLTMTLLLWTVVVIYSIGSVTPELMELEYNTGSKAVVCEIYESRAVNYFTVGLFSALILALLPCWQMIPQWISETKSFVADPTIPQPPLWLSLTLGFAVFWIPYLTVSVACQLFGFGVPPYITVNLLWVQFCMIKTTCCSFRVLYNFCGAKQIPHPSLYIMKLKCVFFPLTVERAYIEAQSKQKNKL